MPASRRIIVAVFIATSLDGFIARPDGDVDWLHEGEALPEHEDLGYRDFIDSIDTLVMGRNSFEKVLEFGRWPYDKPVIVLSRSLKEVPEKLRSQVRIDASSPEALLERLSREGINRVYLDGGRVIQSFLRAGLVDELCLTTLPILLGSGLPLFGDLPGDIHLKHLCTGSWANGFVQSKYLVVK